MKLNGVDVTLHELTQTAIGEARSMRIDGSVYYEDLKYFTSITVSGDIEMHDPFYAITDSEFDVLNNERCYLIDIIQSDSDFFKYTFNVVNSLYSIGGSND